MAAVRSSIRTVNREIRRSFSTISTRHQQTHRYLESNSYLGSWEAPKDPKSAERRLAQLRRDYAKQVKEIRKQYIHEMELLNLEKLRKEEARKETIRAANEERKKLKAEAARVRAEERKVEEEEFRKILLKERAEKLENWRTKVATQLQKNIEKEELLRRHSSVWIDEGQLEKKILEAIVDTSPL